MIQLPIDSRLDEIFQVVDQNVFTLIQAEPGSGKSTRVPPYIAHRDCSSQVFLVQPRRVAAMMTAQRIADEAGVSLGDEFVGYQIRFDKKLTDNTQIQVITEGVLVRKLKSLESNQRIYVILDEFHERNVSTDLLFSWALQESQKNSSLRVVLMSATVGAQSLCDFLPELKMIQVEGQVFPLTISYESKSIPLFDKKLRQQRILKMIEVQMMHNGNTLVFLPSSAQIDEMCSLTQEKFPHLKVYKLYSKLKKEEQDKAINNKSVKSVTFTTNIAETSLTLPLVNCVIDSGLENQSEYSYSKSTYQLRLQRISKSSADQRAGRAARLQKGQCFRLWTPADHSRLNLDIRPELLRLRPSDFLFQCLQLGLNPFNKKNWLDLPEQVELERSQSLLEKMGLKKQEKFQLTALGEEVSKVPMSFNLGYFLFLCKKSNQINYKRACYAAALVSEGDFLVSPEKLHDHNLGDCDLEVRLQLLEDSQMLRGVDTKKSQLMKIEKVKDQLLDLNFKKIKTPIFDSMLEALMFSHYTHLSWRRGNGGSKALRMGGRGVKLSKESFCKKSEYFLILDSFEILGAQPSKETTAHMASAINKEKIQRLFKKEISFQRSVVETKKGEIIIEKQKKLGELPLGQPIREKLSDEERPHVYARSIIENWSQFIKEQPKVENFLNRIKTFNQLFPEEALTIESKEDTLPALEFIFDEYRTIKEALKADLTPYFEMLITESELARINHLLPLTFKLEDRQSKVVYDSVGQAIVSAKLQSLMHLKESPRIAEDKLSLIFEVCAPNYKPIQLTSNLKEFWKTQYPKIRIQYRGRYPKHDWPEFVEG